MTDHLILFPILIPMAFGVLGLVLYRRQKVQAWIALSGMGLSLISSLALFARIRAQDLPLAFQAGGWPAPFGISFVADMLAGLFVVMSQLVLFAGVIHSMGSQERCVRYPAFFPFFLFLATGLTGCLLTGDIFNLFVFIELLAISSTVLTAVSDNRLGPEAAFKYFYMSQLAAFFMLLAVGGIYVSCGTLNMAHLAQLVPLAAGKTLLPLSVAFLTATFMIKGAAFPFHFWQPDFYTAAPTPVAAMLSSVVGKLGIYGFLRMSQLIFTPWAGQLQLLLVCIGIIGVAFGGISALGTRNAKRMLAYSTMAQMGLILTCIGWGTPLSLTAAIVFAFNHSLIKSAMLMLTGYLASLTRTQSAGFDHLMGTGKGRVLAGILFFTGALSLAGIPPTNGFISKMLVFSSGIAAGHIYGLLLIGLSSVFTLVYTMRAFMTIFWQPRADNPDHGTPEPGSPDRLAAPVLLICLVAVLGMAAAPLVDAAQLTAAWLGEPSLYITAVLGGS